MNIEKAKTIILYVVEKTKPKWEKYDEDWDNVDEVFIRRGYEQGGFECWKFAEQLKKHGIFSINSIGQILDNLDKEKCSGKKYDRAFAGSLLKPLYQNMKCGECGAEGCEFYKCVEDFKGNKGLMFWKLLWQMLVCCNYLKNNYNGSFSNFLKSKYCEFKKISKITDSDFLSISPEDWEQFKKDKKHWKDEYLSGIGENVFDFIVGDIKQAKFVMNSFKLDSANEHFLKTTGISKLIENLNQVNVVNFLKKLNLPYTIREINKGIYTYCSKTESQNFGFCRNRRKCDECKIYDLCEKNFN